jgi:hypothetical protein
MASLQNGEHDMKYFKVARALLLLLVAVSVYAQPLPPGRPPDTPTGADAITYDNTSSGLTAQDVQTAIDEVSVLSGGHVIADEGTPRTARPTLDMLGLGIDCVDNPGGSSTDCTVDADMAKTVYDADDDGVVTKAIGLYLNSGVTNAQVASGTNAVTLDPNGDSVPEGVFSQEAGSFNFGFQWGATSGNTDIAVEKTANGGHTLVAHCLSIGDAMTAPSAMAKLCRDGAGPTDRIFFDINDNGAYDSATENYIDLSVPVAAGTTNGTIATWSTGSSQWDELATGSAGTALLSQGSGTDPQWGQVGSTGLADGAVALAKLSACTGPDEVVQYDGGGAKSCVPSDRIVTLANQTLTGGATIADDSCGSMKPIDSTTPITTSVTNTFTAPAAGNDGCFMLVCNENASNAITLHGQSGNSFKGAGDADVVLASQDCVLVTSTGAGGVWYQAAPITTASGGGVDLIDDGDAQTGTTASESGLELVTGELGLIRGCADNEVLSWQEGTGDWTCDAAGVSTDAFKTWNTDLGVNPSADIPTDTIDITSAVAMAITGADTPDSATFDFDYSNEMDSVDIAMLADECVFRADAAGNSGGFVCEGDTADANETEYLFKDANEADVAHEIATLDQIQTMTNKTLTDPTIGSFVNSAHDHGDAAGGGAPDQETIEDLAGALVTGGVETDITVTYQDAAGNIDFVVDTLPNLSGTLDVDSGGTGQTTYTNGQLLIGNDTGNTLAKGSITGGNAVTMTPGTGTIQLDVEIKDDAENAVGTTTSVSGLEFESAELTLLQGCDDAQILKWEEDTDTWDCAVDAGAGGGTTIQVDGGGGEATMNMVSAGSTGIDINLNEAPSPDEIEINFDATEIIGTTTWGGGAAQTFTWDADGVTNPSFAFSDDSVVITGAATFDHVDGSIPVADLNSTVDQTELDNLSGTNSGDEVTATEGVQGILRIATQAEADAGSGTNLAVTADKLEAWDGGTGIATVGTVTAGTWEGTTVAVDQGGTGQTSYTNGQILIGNDTGNTLAKGSITGGNAVTMTPGAGAITLDVEIKDDAEDAVGTTTSVSGLEFESAELTLLQGCEDAEILKWEEDTDTWDCATDGGSGMNSWSLDGDDNDSRTVNDGELVTITGGDGVATNTEVSEAAPEVTVAVNIKGTPEDAVGTTSSASGLEFESTELTMLQGCDNNEILKWVESTDTWDCQADTGGGVVNSVDGEGGGAATTGSVLTFSGSLGITTDSDGSNDFSVAFDYTDGGVADPGLGADECVFSDEGASEGGWVCEGGTADGVETRFRVVDPTTSDKIVTFPDAGGEVSLLGQSIGATEVDADVATQAELDGFTTTDALIITIDDDNATAEPAAGAGIAIEGGSGTDVTLKYETGDNTMDGLGPAGGWDFNILLQNGNGVLDSASTVSVLQQVGTVSTGTWEADTIAVDQGGTGQTSYLDGEILIGNTTGNTLAKASIGGGNAITMTPGAGAITLDVEIKDDAEDAVGTTSSVSGLEFESAELTLLQGCGDAQILKWEEDTDTWDCVNDGGSGMNSFDVQGDDGAPNAVIQDGNVLIITGSAPIQTEDGDAGADTLNITCADAAADGSTKGCATFNATRFSAASGNVDVASVAGIPGAEEAEFPVSPSSGDAAHLDATASRATGGVYVDIDQGSDRDITEATLPDTINDVGGPYTERALEFWPGIYAVDYCADPRACDEGEIQGAIDAAETIGGNNNIVKVILPPTTIDLTCPGGITIEDGGIILEGAGFRGNVSNEQGTVFAMPAAADCAAIIVDASAGQGDHILRNFAISAPADIVSGAVGIRANDTTNLTIESVGIISADTSPWATGTVGLELDDAINTNVIGSSYIRGWERGIRVHGGSNATTIKNYSLNNNEVGIEVDDARTTSLNGVVIETTGDTAAIGVLMDDPGGHLIVQESEFWNDGTQVVVNAGAYVSMGNAYNDSPQDQIVFNTDTLALDENDLSVNGTSEQYIDDGATGTFSAVQVGQWVDVGGYTNGGNNGLKFVTAKPDNDTITVAQDLTTEAAPASATFDGFTADVKESISLGDWYSQDGVVSAFTNNHATDCFTVSNAHFGTALTANEDFPPTIGAGCVSISENPGGFPVASAKGSSTIADVTRATGGIFVDLDADGVADVLPSTVTDVARGGPHTERRLEFWPVLYAVDYCADPSACVESEIQAAFDHAADIGDDDTNHPGKVVLPPGQEIPIDCAGGGLTISAAGSEGLIVEGSGGAVGTGNDEADGTNLRMLSTTTTPVGAAADCALLTVTRGDVTLRDFTIDLPFDVAAGGKGIVLDSAEDAIIENVDISSHRDCDTTCAPLSGTTGVELTGSIGVSIENVELWGWGIGLHVDDDAGPIPSNSTNVIGGRIRNGLVGVQVNGGYAAVLTGTIVEGNSTTGILIDDLNTSGGDSDVTLVGAWLENAGADTSTLVDVQTRGSVKSFGSHFGGTNAVQAYLFATDAQVEGSLSSGDTFASNFGTREITNNHDTECLFVQAPFFDDFTAASTGCIIHPLTTGAVGTSGSTTCNDSDLSQTCEAGEGMTDSDGNVTIRVDNDDDDAINGLILQTGTGTIYYSISDDGINFNVVHNDQDTCDLEGEWWYDGTDDRFEFCEATSGVPTSFGIAKTPASVDVTGGGTIADDACGSVKRITSTGPVTTSTTNTFTAPSAANEGCVMLTCNDDSADTITLHGQSGNSFKGAGDADVALAPQDCVLVTSTGAGGVWYQAAPKTTISGSGAPTTSQYVVGAADGGLSAEKILTDGQGIDTVISGGDAGSATIDLAYTDTLAADPGFGAKECVFTTEGTGGGGFLCEGSAATPNETIYRFKALDEVDAEHEIVTLDQVQTLTNKTLTSPTLTTPALGTPSALVVNATNTTGSLDLGAGTIRGGVSVETTTSTTHALGAAEGQWLFADETGATEIDIPALASGSSFCVYSATAQVLSIDPNGTEVIVLDGTTLSAGEMIDSPGAIGDFICLLSNGTNWYTLGRSGTWVEETP